MTVRVLKAAIESQTRACRIRGKEGFGSSKSAPWRAGANENTTIEFSTDVKIEGKSLPAGKYGFFVAYDPAEPTLIFSKNSSSWGSYYYDEREDALRVKVKSQALAQNIVAEIDIHKSNGKYSRRDAAMGKII